MIIQNPVKIYRTPQMIEFFILGIKKRLHILNTVDLSICTDTFLISVAILFITSIRDFERSLSSNSGRRRCFTSRDNTWTRPIQ